MKTFLSIKLITTQHHIHSYFSQSILLSTSFSMKFTAIAIISALIAPLAYAAALSPANINALRRHSPSSLGTEMQAALYTDTHPVGDLLDVSLHASAKCCVVAVHAARRQQAQRRQPSVPA